MRPSMNDGVMGGMELYSCRLSAGRYTLVLPAGRSFRPGLTLQLREGQAFYWFPASMLMLLVGVRLVVYGIIFGFFMRSEERRVGKSVDCRKHHNVRD